MKFTVCMPVEITDKEIVDKFIKKVALNWCNFNNIVGEMIENGEIFLGAVTDNPYQVISGNFTTDEEITAFRKECDKQLLKLDGEKPHQMNILERIEYYMDEYGMTEEDAERCASIDFGFAPDDE